MLYFFHVLSSSLYLPNFFLKEFIGIRRWSAIAFGFMGVLIVLNPNFSNFEYRNLLPVLSALFYAASMTITKYTSDKDDVNTQLYLLLFNCSYIVWNHLFIYG